MITLISKIFGRFYALLNNAVIASLNHIATTLMESAEKIFQTNVFRFFLLLREVSKLMISCKRCGIINSTRIANPLNQEGEVVYASSKSAVQSFTNIAAKELLNYSIIVKAVGSSYVSTDLIKKVPKPRIDSLLRRKAIKQQGTFENFKNAVSFFLRPQSNFIINQIL